MDQELYKAAKEGDVSCLSEIDGRNITEVEAMRIQDGIFLNRTQHGNNNILHIAARAGRDTFVAEALRRFPFLSDQVNSQGDTPLLVAARFGHLQVVKTLAEPNNELPMQDDDMATAVESGTNSRSSRRQRDVEEGLVDHQSEQGTVQDNVATMENGTNSSNISHHQRDMEERLLDNRLEQATAVENGTNSRDKATTLENETNSSSSRNQRDAEEVLVDRQLIHGTTTLHEALRNGHEEVARYLLRLDPEMATLVNVEIISTLIEQKPDLMRQRDDHGKAAIHYAVEANYWVLARQMLKADASIALFPDNDGHTPLLGAASSGYDFSCKVILKICPESIEARNHEGRHALHLCKCRDARFLMRIPEILELLNEGDDEGNTPLHLAIKKNDYEKAMLLSSSAIQVDLGAVNKEGLTALDLCCQTDEKNIPKRYLV
ncbi:hypothetical protein RHSIM_Rhsim04G0028400 [Rhododendron simsii]|uniref:Uncharacterized protein n=1 Tax=Rhododendron simsii TaxID=118357 RepID=A0A834HAF2_RHOSS|nr:hypothetical protein RHSIM_Rhsim04G0028400 [Rhododendron simsii]